MIKVEKLSVWDPARILSPFFNYTTTRRTGFFYTYAREEEHQQGVYTGTVIPKNKKPSSLKLKRR
ncbi:MAG: hypothetical protein WBC89_00640 [Dehalococcoidia bacterium]